MCCGRSMAGWIGGVGIALLVSLLITPVHAHETDNFSMPPEQAFVDFGPLFTRIFYRNLDRAVERVNERIRYAEQAGESDDELAELRSPETIAYAVRRAFPHTLTLIDDVDRLVASKQTQRRFPGQLTDYEPFDYIYSHSSFILDPRQVFKLWRATMIKIDGTYLGSDKLGHFIAKGYINYDRYREERAAGAPREQAVQAAIAIGTGDDFFYSEKRMVGYFSSGVLSNGDLAADYLGLKFFINLTEPVMLRGRLASPMLQLDENGYWRLAPHVQPDSDFFTRYISDHLNEVLNPSVMEKIMRDPVQEQIAKRRDELLARYSDRFGNRRPKAWFEQRMRELSTYYGDEYGNEKNFDSMITVANTCYAPHEFESVTDRSPLGRTVLHQAAAGGELAKVREAIANGADVNAPVRSKERYSAAWGNRPLHYAARGNHADIVRLLLEHGAAVNAANDRGITPLHRAAQVGGASLTLLLDANADVNAADEMGRTPLHWAATYERTDVVRRLISGGADIAARDHEQRTPLHHAAEWGQPRVIVSLLDAGADIEARAAYGVTPLFLAASAGKRDAAGGLITAGADVAAADDTGQTPLHAAAMHGHTPVADLLLYRGADANAADAYGGTALHLAARRNNTRLIEVLLDNGAAPNAANRFKRTALHIAAAQSHDETLELLTSRGGDMTRQTIGGDTPRDVLRHAERGFVERFLRRGQMRMDD